MNRALIFDLDGVVADTGEAHYKSWQRLADEEEIAFDREANQRLLGRTRSDSLDRLLGERFLDAPTRTAWLERKQTYFLDSLALMDSGDILPGVAELLSEARRRGIPLGLASSSSNAHAVLDRLDLESAFDVVADASTVTHPKPAPDIYRWVADQLGVVPRDCIVVEDAEAGIAAAHAAGCRVVTTGPIGTHPLAAAHHASLAGVSLDDLFDVKPKTTLLVFSHLRWDFVWQRPQQLMTRFATDSPVLFWQEPIIGAVDETPRIDVTTTNNFNVTTITPCLPDGLTSEDRNATLAELLDELLTRRDAPIIRWYYTPMMVPFSRHVAAECIVYDCMDELANFANAPAKLAGYEAELLGCANLVFTGGYALQEAKQALHPSVHLFPSSVDTAHFRIARDVTDDDEPEDQRDLPSPRFGYYGVIDERLDLVLITELAETRPDWTIIMVGPVAKIDPTALPRLVNIIWLGSKTYAELPCYVSGWDVALMPFAIGPATRFISPTKTPEYLAAGLPVVTTPVPDVVREYGPIEAVEVAEDADGFVAACASALALRHGDDRAWLTESDLLLAGQSWDRVAAEMRALIEATIAAR